MSPWQTALIFAGIPLLVVALVSFAVFGRSALHQPNRYRPGRPWNYPPAWYVPHPEATAGAVAEHAAIESGDTASDDTASEGATSGVTAAGGAKGEW